MSSIQQTIEKTLQGLVHLLYSFFRTFVSYLFTERDLNLFLPANENKEMQPPAPGRYVGPLSYVMISMAAFLIIRYAFSPYALLDSIGTQAEPGGHGYLLERWISPVVASRDAGKLLSIVFPGILLVVCYSALCKLFANTVNANVEFITILSINCYGFGSALFAFALFSILNSCLIQIGLRLAGKANVQMVIPAALAPGAFIFLGLLLRVLYRHVIWFRNCSDNSWLKVTAIILGALTITSATLVFLGFGIGWW